jgi:hypothetical protein
MQQDPVDFRVCQELCLSSQPDRAYISGPEETAWEKLHGINKVLYIEHLSHPRDRYSGGRWHYTPEKYSSHFIKHICCSSARHDSLSKYGQDPSRVERFFVEGVATEGKQPSRARAQTHSTSGKPKLWWPQPDSHPGGQSRNFLLSRISKTHGRNSSATKARNLRTEDSYTRKSCIYREAEMTWQLGQPSAQNLEANTPPSDRENDADSRCSVRFVPPEDEQVCNMRL